MSATGSQPEPCKPWAADLERLRHECGVGETMTDDLADHLESRVVAIEEVLAARGWRRLILRWRLARDLRSQVVERGQMDGSWQDRRTEFVGQSWLRQ